MIVSQSGIAVSKCLRSGTVDHGTPRENFNHQGESSAVLTPVVDVGSLKIDGFVGVILAGTYKLANTLHPMLSFVTAEVFLFTAIATRRIKSSARCRLESTFEVGLIRKIAIPHGPWYGCKCTEQSYAYLSIFIAQVVRRGGCEV